MKNIIIIILLFLLLVVLLQLLVVDVNTNKSPKDTDKSNVFIQKQPPRYFSTASRPSLFIRKLYTYNFNTIRLFSSERVDEYNKANKTQSFKFWIDSSVLDDGMHHGRFVEEIYKIKDLKVDTRYLLMLKIRKNDYYLMLGNQRLFYISDDKDESLIRLYGYILAKLPGIFEEYIYLDNIFDSIQLEFKELTSNSLLSSKPSLNSIKDIIPKSEYNSFNTGFSLFGNYFYEHLGKPINWDVDDKGVWSINLILNNKTINLVDFFNVLSKQVKNPQVYYLNWSSKVYIKENRNIQYIIVLNFISPDTVIKRAFNSDGICLSSESLL